METEKRREGKQEQENSHATAVANFLLKELGFWSVSESSADTSEDQVLATATLQLQKQYWHLFNMNSDKQYLNLAVPFV